MRKLKRALVSLLNAGTRSGFRVGVFMMQKDENRLLPIFLKYYGSRFGYENIYLFDNGSADHMAPALQQARDLGVNVVTEFNTKKDFERKGRILGDAMNKRLHMYDVTLPLDCDEFVAVKLKDNTYSCSQRDLIEHFKMLEPGIYKTNQRLRNHPEDTTKFFDYSWGNRKLVFRKTNAAKLDIGFHNCADNSKVRPSSLAYFELHHKPFEMLLQHTRNKMAARLDFEDSDKLNSYKGKGVHLVKYLKMQDERDYIRYLEKQSWFGTEVVKDALAEQGVKDPFQDISVKTP